MRRDGVGAALARLDKGKGDGDGSDHSRMGWRGSGRDLGREWVTPIGALEEASSRAKAVRAREGMLEGLGSALDAKQAEEAAVAAADTAATDAEGRLKMARYKAAGDPFAVGDAVEGPLPPPAGPRTPGRIVGITPADGIGEDAIAAIVFDPTGERVDVPVPLLGHR